MNGAELALGTAAELGVEVCFANPGTTEMELVAALDDVDGLRSVLCLFEGVATGAADGYGRVAGTPALTLTHLGPGFANGIANLHNARRAHTPVVNLIGDHASWHLVADAPLTSDIESLAVPVSLHVGRMTAATHGASAMTDAVRAALGPPSGVATLIVPQDSAWGDAGLHDVPDPIEPTAADTTDAIGAAAAALRTSEGTALLLGGVVRGPELEAAARIADATGAAVWIDTFTSVVEQGRTTPSFPTVPYFPEQAIEALAGVQTLIAAGTGPPVAFFGYESVGRSGLLPAGVEVITITPPGERGHRGLDAVVDALGCPAAPEVDRPPVELPTGSLDAATLGASLAALVPYGAIVVNEAATSGLGWGAAAAGAAPHEVLSLTGGAIGQGLPCAVGAAIAAPDRPVVAFQADGSGLYTLQSLWTMAREGLDVTVVVCANRAYRILQVELHRTGNTSPGPAATALTELSDPAPDWVALASGFGVEGMQATTLAEVQDGIRRGLAEEGPFLVEVLL
ncbi:MAG: acetolactate synthase large subunit [Actinomycetota bacterium]